MDILIAGAGFVGMEQAELFPEAILYDPFKGRRYGRIMKKIPDKAFDIVFVCVPTPMQDSGACDLTAFHDVMQKIKADVFVIRSTIPPGTTDLYENAVFQPEYVASSSPYPAPLGDISRRDFIILGGKKEHVKKVRRLYEKVYPPTCRIMETTARTAEIIKLCENTAIAAKVTLCQEFYEICKAFGVDYHDVQEGVFELDPRFNKWFTNVYPDNRGFTSSHCLPKDLNSLVFGCKVAGYDAMFIRDILKNNERWKNEK